MGPVCVWKSGRTQQRELFSASGCLESSLESCVLESFEGLFTHVSGSDVGHQLGLVPPHLPCPVWPLLVG